MGCINSKNSKMPYCPCCYSKVVESTPVQEVKPATPTKVVQSIPVQEVMPATPTKVVQSTPVQEVKPATPAEVVQSTPVQEVMPATPAEVVQSTPVQEVKPATPAEVVQFTPVQEVKPATLTEVVQSTPVQEVKPATPAEVVQFTPYRDSRSQNRATMARNGWGRVLDRASIKGLTKQQLQCLGLPNLGQSCYMNASIQCMLRMESFCQKLLQTQHIWRNNPATGLLKCFVDVRAARYAHHASHKRRLLKALLDCVAEEADEFQDGNQKDAHEFFCVLLAQMAALAPLLQGGALEGGAYTCPVRTSLHFMMLSTRTCRQCGLQSSKQEDFTNISLAMVAGSSVKACLQQHLQETELEFRCSCGGLTSGQRGSFLTLPRMLVVQLNRFCPGAVGWQLEKSEKPIVLTRELLLFAGLSGDEALLSPPALVHVSTEDGSDRARSCPMGSRYSLVSVLSHLGSSATSGHYVCDCHYADGDPEDQTDRWLSYNDDIVLETTGQLVCLRRQKSAYVLCYERQQ